LAAARDGTGAPIVNASRPRAIAALCVAALVFDLFLTLPAAEAQPSLTTTQSEALNRYNKALNDFKSILSHRRAQIDAKQPLPNLPGQALYLARNTVMAERQSWNRPARPSLTWRAADKLNNRLARQHAVF
jgi:hypothetical protein